MANIDLRRPLKKFLPHFISARESNLNEADTVQRIMRFFEEVLGYDPMTELTCEMQVKDKFVDLAIKVEGSVRLLIEVKAAGTDLRDRHIEQAERYAAENNLHWVLLTNGVSWNLYHLTFDEGIEYERAFTIDLSTADIDQAAEYLTLLHRQSIRKDEHEEFWSHRKALSPSSIGKALFTEEVLRFIRREIRRREGLLVDEEDLAKAINEMFSVETRESMGPVRVRRRRVARKRKGSSQEGLPAAASLNATAPPKDRVQPT